MLVAHVSMQRIETFLKEPEVPDWASSLKSVGKEHQEEVGFRNATFQWDVAPREEPVRFTLGPLNLTFRKGQLNVISGPTGSGKSALLNAFLGGMSRSIKCCTRDADRIHRNELHVGSSLA
jgi:ABC-type siderophore export system fused ATPase/permease subunit